MNDNTKVAIVTGGARGIGQGISKALAKAGFKVMICDLDDSETKNELEKTISDIKAQGGEAEYFQCDISDLNLQQKLLEHTVNLWGRLDCLVSNAGVSVMSRGDLLNVSPESFDRCIKVNTRAPFFLIQAFTKKLLSLPRPSTHQSIIVISSSNAEMVSIDRGEYSVSKRATTMTARLFALRLAAENVGVYEIRPGLIKTRMTKPSEKKYDRLIDDGLVPARRWGYPEDIAITVTAMAQGQLPYTCGLPVPIDGGLSMPAF